MGFERHAAITRRSFFRFYAELNDFLPIECQKTAFAFDFTGKPTVKDMVEAIGVPHCEIDLILIGGRSVDFTYSMQGGERVAVYPMFESFDIAPLIRLRAAPLRQSCFIVDVNLGKLARKLRLLGFDTLYRNDFGDNEIVEISVAEKRIILTRDLGLLKHGAVTHGYWVRSDDPMTQVKEVVDRFQLENSFQPMIRCSDCNGLLKQVEQARVEERLPPETLNYCDIFWQCQSCQKLYWRGSHYSHIQKWIKGLSH